MERWTIAVCVQFDIVYFKNLSAFHTFDTIGVSLPLNPVATLNIIMSVMWYFMSLVVTYSPPTLTGAGHM